jgi:hypothetical protein
MPSAHQNPHEHATRPKPSACGMEALSNERSTMRKLVVALVASAIGVGVVVAPAAAEPPPQACIGGVVSSSVQPSSFPDIGPGRRAVATEFFGEFGPQAVQAAQRALQGFCAS